jgi:hypothetical protein
LELSDRDVRGWYNRFSSSCAQFSDWHVLVHPEKNIIFIAASTGSILSPVERDINRLWSWKNGIRSGDSISSKSRPQGHPDSENVIGEVRLDLPMGLWKYYTNGTDWQIFLSVMISAHSKDVSKPFPGWNTLIHGPKLCPVEFHVDDTNVMRYFHLIANQSLEIIAIANFAIWYSEHTTMNRNRSN